MKYLYSNLLRISSTLLVPLLLFFLQISNTFADEYFFANIKFESAFSTAKDVPLEWIELMIYSKDPKTVEFYERPIETVTLSKENMLRFKLKVNDFTLGKIWILYRFDKKAVRWNEIRPHSYLEILYNRYLDSAWLFELPFFANIDEISIEGNKLFYKLRHSAEQHVVNGSPFRASYFPFRKGRKEGGYYVRLDRLSHFVETAYSLNKDLPEQLKINPQNERICQASINLYKPFGEASLGPKEIDKPVVKQGYIPFFIIVKGSSEDLILQDDKSWLIAPETQEKVIYTDLRIEAPQIWKNLTPEAKKRYEISTMIKAEEEAKLIVFWKPGQQDRYFPSLFFMYSYSKASDKFRTIVFHRIESTLK